MQNLAHVLFKLRLIDLANLRLTCRRSRVLVEDHRRWHACDWSNMLTSARILVQVHGVAWWEAQVGCPMTGEEWHRLIPQSDPATMCRLVPRQITSTRNIFTNHVLTKHILPLMCDALRIELCSTITSYPRNLAKDDVVDFISTLMLLPGDLTVDGSHAWFLLPPYLADPVIYAYLINGGCLGAVRDGVTTVYSHLATRIKQPPAYVLVEVQRASRCSPASK